MNTDWNTPRRIALAAIAMSIAIPGAHAQTQTSVAGSASNAPKEQVHELSEFVVSSSADTGYDVTDSVSGIRFRTDLLTLPKTINVATAEWIKDIGAFDLAQVIGAMNGAMVETVSGNSVTDLTFRFRGVAASFVYRNGFRGFAPVDPISIDRVEIIKGPSSFFGGQVQAGGFVNYVTKKPTGKEYTSVSQLVGSFNTFRTEFEKSGAIGLGKDRKLLYRAAFMHHTNDTFREFENQEKWSPFIALSYKLTERTTISADYQYLKRKLGMAHTMPLYLVLGPESGNYTRFRPREDFNAYGPDAFAGIGSALAELSVDHRFAEWLSVRGSLFQSRTFHTRFNPNVGNLISTNATTGARTITRSNATFLNQSNDDRTARVDLLGNWTFGPAKLKAYAGWERVYGKFMVTNRFSPGNSLTPVNIDNPNYDIGTPANATLGSPFPFYAIYEAGSGGAHLELYDRLNVFAGTRRDDGYSLKQLGQPVTATTKFDVDTPYFGASFKITPNVALFVSESESFVPNQGFKFDGSPLPPLTGEGTDVGVKFTGLLGGTLSGQLTAFDQTISNARLADPANPGFFITSGAAEKSQGFEAEFSYRPLSNWRLTAGYAHTDAKTVFSLNPAAINRRPANTPTHELNFLSNYTFTSGPVTGLGVIVTANYVSNRRSTPGVVPDTALNWLPSYVKFDAVLSYPAKVFGRTANLTLAVRNLTDKEYYVSWSGYGAPRTFEASATMRF